MTRGKEVEGARFVLDASAMAAFLLKEEEGEAVASLLRGWSKAGAQFWVPPLFWCEIVNILMMAMRRGRLLENQASDLLDVVCEFPLQTDDETPGRIQRRIFRLAHQHNLTAYDAAYVELSERLGARLKTMDRDLLKLKKTFPFIL